MNHLNRSIGVLLEPHSNFCPKNASEQEQLLIASAVYLIGGSLLAVPLLLVYILFIIFFVCKKKARQSSICIFLLFLSLFNTLKLAEFILTLLIKLKLIEFSDGQQIKYEYKLLKIYLCNLIYFLDKLSSLCAVYIVIFIQFQKYLLIRCRKESFSRLVIYNWSLALMACIIISLLFIALNSFYLYDEFYILVTFCPFTLNFNCVVNSKFRILNSFKFDSFLYEHVHTLFYNVIPFLMILALNKKILDKLNKLNSKSRKKSLTNFIKMSKKYKAIHLDLADVDYFSIIASLSCVCVTFFTTILSYLAEWNTQIVEANFEQKSIKQSDFKEINSKYYTHVTSVYIVISLLEYSNFGFFLIYQLINCELLKCELKVFILKNILRRRV